MASTAAHAATSGLTAAAENVDKQEAIDESVLSRLDSDISRLEGQLAKVPEGGGDDRLRRTLQGVLGAKAEEREILLEERRVEDVRRAFLEENPPDEEECPLCLEPMSRFVGAAFPKMPRFLCCGKCVCPDCFKGGADLAGKLKRCPLCREPLPNSNNEALRKVKAQAKSGHAWAQSLLGEEYFQGVDIEEDNAKALRCFRLAAEQGDAESEAKLGFLYDTGYGDIVPQSESEARRWYGLAASKGHVEAQASLAEMILEGRGGPVDPQEGVYFLTLAALGGKPHAQVTLARFFERSTEGLSKSLERAKYWYGKAALQNDDGDGGVAFWSYAVALLQLARQRYDGEQDLPGHSAVPEAMYWCRKAEENGNYEAVQLMDTLTREAKLKCAFCHKLSDDCVEKLKPCPRCRSAYYCNKHCQAEHWNRLGHKIDCKKSYHL